MREKGIGRVVEIFGDMGLDACILRGMDNIFYLTGFRGSEGVLVVTRGDVLLLTDSRYVTHATEVTKDVKVVETQPRTNTLSEVCERYAIHSMGFDGVNTTYDVYARWKEQLAGVEITPLPVAIEAIRAVKEPAEIEAIKKAVRCATDAFNETFEKIRPGVTEKAIARDLEYAMERHGADSPSFSTIVASGPRAAMPHAEPTDKELREGEVVIIDFGAQVDGYCSDETCTLSVGEPNGKIHEIFSIVQGALDLGLRSIKAGMPAGDLDMIVRGFIEERGYGAYFRHGLGHGVGVAVHEAPTVSTQSGGLLEANMVFTVEPGIYVPHLGGVRLEDMVLLEEDRTTILTHIRKDMLKIKV